MTVCLELHSTVLCVCHRKLPKERLAPPKLPEPQLHLVHIALLPACCVQVGRISAAMWKFDPLVLTVLVLGNSTCRGPVQKQGEDSRKSGFRPSTCWQGATKRMGDDIGRGGRLMKVKGYEGTMTTVDKYCINMGYPMCNLDNCCINAVYLWGLLCIRRFNP